MPIKQQKQINIFLTIGLNDTHAGGVAVVMYELDYTGIDLAYYNASVSATSGSISVTNAYPNRLWSDHPTATARTWSGTKLQSFWANGTSNAGPATPSNNNSVTWTSNFNVEHGTNEHAHFASGQYNLCLGKFILHANKFWWRYRIIFAKKWRNYFERRLVTFNEN